MIGKSAKSYPESDDINAGVEDSSIEDQRQHINERLEKAVGVYAEDYCSIPGEWGNTFPCRQIVR